MTGSLIATASEPRTPDTLAADVDRLTARRAELIQALAEATAAAARAEDAFADGDGTAEALGSAQAALASATAALSAIETRLAPLRAQLEERQAIARAKATRAEQRRRIFSAARECAAAVDGMR